MKDRQNRRLERQLQAFAATSPRLGALIRALQGRRAMLIRLPLAIFFILGSFLAILPVFGLWMLPIGLLLLAMDLPVLRPLVSAAIIRLRRRAGAVRRWWRAQHH